MRNQGGTFVEHNLDLVVAVVEPGHDPVVLDGDRRAALLRNLLSSTLRREGVVEPGLVEALRAADTALAQQLRRPGEDRTMRYALFPLAAVVVD